MSITSIGVSALTAFRQALDTTGHNIANVSSDGYSRQRIDFTAREPTYTGNGYIGNGVEASSVQRQYDTYIASQMRGAQALTSQLQSYYDMSSQLDQLVADEDLGLQPAIQNFFNALQELSDDPSAISSRQLVLTEAESLVDRFHYFSQQFDGTRSRLNDQIKMNVTEINRLAEAIADVNASIVGTYGAGSSDLFDKRDQLVNELSDLVSVQVLEQSDGAYNVFIGKGQPLVLANKAAAMSTQVSRLDARHLEITVDYAYGAQLVTDQISGGAIGGLLKFRDEVLYPTQNRVGLVALGIADQLNAQNALGIDLEGIAGSDLFTLGAVETLVDPANGSSITVDYNDIGELTGSDYQLVYDGTDYILENLNDGTTQTLAAGLNTVDGLDITIDATGAVAGDIFLIHPTRNASSEIELRISDVRRLAAASPLVAAPATDANGNPLNTGSATITQPANSGATGLPLAANIELVYNAGAGGFDILNGPAPPDDFIAYDATDPTQIAGVDFPDSGNPTQFDAFGGLSFTIAGVPADGDTFIIGNNSTGESDNRNALLLADLENVSSLLSGTASFEDVYGQMVSQVGAKTHYAEQNLAAQESLLARTKESMAEVSGVNLDEEAAKLIQYQQAYQAAAQIISAASTLFDTLISAVRR